MRLTFLLTICLDLLLSRDTEALRLGEMCGEDAECRTEVSGLRGTLT